MLKLRDRIGSSHGFKEAQALQSVGDTLWPTQQQNYRNDGWALNWKDGYLSSFWKCCSGILHPEPSCHLHEWAMWPRPLHHPSVPNLLIQKMGIMDHNHTAELLYGLNTCEELRIGLETGRLCWWSSILGSLQSCAHRSSLQPTLYLTDFS